MMDGDPDLFDQVIPPGSNTVLCEDLFAKLEWAEHKFVDREHGFCQYTYPLLAISLSLLPFLSLCLELL